MIRAAATFAVPGLSIGVLFVVVKFINRLWLSFVLAIHFRTDLNFRFIQNNPLFAGWITAFRLPWQIDIHHGIGHAVRHGTDGIHIVDALSATRAMVIIISIAQ